MFDQFLHVLRAKAASKTAVVTVTVAALVAAAGGWAFASFRPGHIATSAGSTGTLVSAALHTVGTAGAGASGTASGTGHSPSGSSTNGQQGAAPQAGSGMPAGLLLATSQGQLDLNAPGGSAPSDHSATGGGSTTFFHFGFTAQSHRNGNVAGTVTGNAQIVFEPPFPGPLHIDVNCLRIVGNDAVVSGTLARPAFGLSKGTEMLFVVRDDDSSAKPDMISDIFFSPGPTPFTCKTFHVTPQHAVQGNVEIH